MSISELIQHARTLIQQKQFEQALNFLNAHNELEQQESACSLKGQCAYALSRWSEAQTYYNLVIKLNPESYAAWYNLANTLKFQGLSDEAEVAFQKAIDLNPNFFQALFNLANLLVDKGDLDRAETNFLAAINANPSYTAAYNNLGFLYQNQQRWIEAEQMFAQAIQIDPNFADAHLNRAIVLSRLGQIEQSKLAYKEAIKLQPKMVVAYNNLANLLSSQQEYLEAEQLLGQAVQINPNYAEAYNSLGVLLWRQKRLLEAEQSLFQSIRVNPKYTSAYINLGLVYIEQKRIAEGESAYRKALEINSNDVQALTHLGFLLRERRRYTEAKKIYQRLYHIKTAQRKSDNSSDVDLDYLGNLLDAKSQMCDWEGWLSLEYEFVSCLEQGFYVGQPFISLFLPNVSATSQRKLAQLYAYRKVGHELDLPVLVDRSQSGLVNASSKSSRLHIGYLSPDFGKHPITSLLTDVLHAHNREEYKISLYACGEREEGPERRRLREIADHFIDVHLLSDEEAAKRIRDDQVDILVDLAGYTQGARQGITARRPSPVIAAWLGYIGTLGEKRLADYVLGDEITTPKEHASFFSENIVQLPNCFQPNMRREHLLEVHRAQFSLPDDAIVLCSFNQAFKLNPELWDDWCEILQRSHKAVLWLAPLSDVAQKNLRKVAHEQGIESERIIFAQQLPLFEHQSRIQVADLALDTFPYGSGTTASDVLRAGVPLVTRVGETFVSRMAASLLHSLQLDELVTQTRAEYIDLVCRLANNPSELMKIRERLMEQLECSALFNPELFAVNLEKAYSEMWSRYQNNNNTNDVVKIIEQ